MAHNPIDVYLAEFEAVRNDILARFEFQRQSFNYLIALIVALFAFAASWQTKAGYEIDPFQYVILAPLLAAPLAYMFFDNEIMLCVNGKYINESLRQRIKQTLEYDALCLEDRLKLLTKRQNFLHLLLSVGRWLLFFIPLVGPTLYGILKADFWSGSIQLGVVVPNSVVLILDIILTLLAVFAAVGVVAMRLDAWKMSKKEIAGLIVTTTQTTSL